MIFLSMKIKIDLLIEKAKYNAKKPLAEKILGFVSSIESIIFPIPVDPFLAGLTFAAPKKVLKFALFCTDRLCYRRCCRMVAGLFYRTFN